MITKDKRHFIKDVAFPKGNTALSYSSAIDTYVGNMMCKQQSFDLIHNGILIQEFIKSPVLSAQ